MIDFLKRHRWSLSLSGVAALCFLRLAREMREGELDAFDAGVRRALFRVHGRRMDGAMLALTRVGNGVSLVVICALSCGALAWSGRRREALFLALSGGGTALFEWTLKLFFHRTRPVQELAYRLVVPSSFSFPSGHAMGSMGVFASLAVLVCVSGASRSTRVAAVAVTGTAVAGIGMSRVYFGVHYPSDVIGGELAGAAWVSAVTGWFWPRLLPGEHALEG